MIVYKLIHNEFKKVYIGLSEKEPDEAIHYLPEGSKIKRAVDNFGISSFHTRKIIEFKGKEKAIEKANQLIDFHDDNCYNEEYYELEVRDEEPISEVEDFYFMGFSL